MEVAAGQASCLLFAPVPRLANVCVCMYLSSAACILLHLRVLVLSCRDCVSTRTIGMQSLWRPTFTRFRVSPALTSAAFALFDTSYKWKGARCFGRAIVAASAHTTEVTRLSLQYSVDFIRGQL
eukprot:1404820-Pleurochrysis_carterae.AAC.2